MLHFAWERCLCNKYTPGVGWGGCKKASAAGLALATGCCAVTGLPTTWGTTRDMAGARGHCQQARRSRQCQCHKPACQGNTHNSRSTLDSHVLAGITQSQTFSSMVPVVTNLYT